MKWIINASHNKFNRNNNWPENSLKNNPLLPRVSKGKSTEGKGNKYLSHIFSLNPQSLLVGTTLQFIHGKRRLGNNQSVNDSSIHLYLFIIYYVPGFLLSRGNKMMNEQSILVLMKLTHQWSLHTNKYFITANCEKL